MTLQQVRTQVASHAHELAALLESFGIGPYYGTPCGVLAPLYAVLQRGSGLTTISREDTAVGVAVGAALASARPCVVIQNSGFGQCVNALASLVVPYRVPVLFVISLRGVGIDDTPENLGMGLLTQQILDALDVPTTALAFDGDWRGRVSRTVGHIAEGRSPAALLIEPTAFGWLP